MKYSVIPGSPMLQVEVGAKPSAFCSQCCGVIERPGFVAVGPLDLLGALVTAARRRQLTCLTCAGAPEVRHGKAA